LRKSSREDLVFTIFDISVDDEILSLLLLLLLLLRCQLQTWRRYPSPQCPATSSTKIGAKWSRSFRAVYVRKTSPTQSTRSSLYSEVVYCESATSYSDPETWIRSLQIF